MTSSTRRESGFTLVELMVVVAIISILAIVAMPALKTPVDVETTARGVASVIGEAARTAVVHGGVPPAVATDAGENARTKIEIRITAVPHRIHVWIQTGTTTSSWVQHQYMELPRGVRVAGFDDAALLSAGGAMASQDNIISCPATGQCEPKTIYLHRDNGSEKYKIVVLPLSTAPQVLEGW